MTEASEHREDLKTTAVDTPRMTEGLGCPKCGSTATLSVEELADSDRWLCRACGKKWRQPTHPGRGNRLWPNVDTLENAKKAAHEAAGVAIFIAAVNAIVAVLILFEVKLLNGDWWAFLISGVLAACIAWRMWKLSRAWAIVGLVWWLSEIAFTVYSGLRDSKYPQGAHMKIILLVGFIHGVRGTFAYHRLSREASPIPGLAKPIG